LVPDFRRFAASTRAVDENWSTSASSNDVWTPTGIVWGTNNGPVQLVNGHGLLGVQKPGHDHPTNPHTAATEKIVADLAYQLGLPVPPLTLWDRGAPAGEPRRVAVSAWAYDNALQWDQAAPGLSAAQQDALRPWASAMVPFESWIAAQDRQNPGNVLVSTDTNGEILAAWIDYAFSLDHVWCGNHIVDCSIPQVYPPVGAPLPEIMKEVADTIVAMDNAIIEGIVNRIPVEYLPRAIADNIIRNLLTRRSSVRALL
jgi:hypothetical protein